MRILELLLDAALPPRETEALVRRTKGSELFERLSPVMTGAGGHGVMSLFPYEDPLVQACILEAKFEGSQRAAEFLGRALREFLYEFLAESTAFDPSPPVFVPLPLSAGRFKERGYNQVERVLSYAIAVDERAERGAPSLGAKIDTDLLRRIRETMPQTSLSGNARRKNVAGAFGASPCSPYRTYIVVDDVITTGNTMLAACEALRAAGASRLLPLTFAY